MCYEIDFKVGAINLLREYLFQLFVYEFIGPLLLSLPLSYFWNFTELSGSLLNSQGLKINQELGQQNTVDLSHLHVVF